MHSADKVGELKEKVCENEGLMVNRASMILQHGNGELTDFVQWCETCVFDEKDPILHIYKR